MSSCCKANAREDNYLLDEGRRRSAQIRDERATSQSRLPSADMTTACGLAQDMEPPRSG